jgi:hypothetical protein
MVSVPVAEVPPVVTTRVESVFVWPDVLLHAIVVTHPVDEVAVQPVPVGSNPSAPITMLAVAIAEQWLSLVVKASW